MKDSAHRHGVLPRLLLRQLRDGRLLSLVILLGIWQFVTWAGHLNPELLPSVSSVAVDWVHLVADGELGSALANTLGNLFIGFGIAVVVGVPLGLAMGIMRTLRFAIDPYITVLLSTPFVAFVPVLIVWLGIGTKILIGAAVLFSFPLIVANVQAGVRTIPRSLLEMARAFETSGLQILRKIVLPGSLGSVLVGLQQGLSHAVKGVIIAEMLTSSHGLGGLVITYGDSFRAGPLLAVVLTALVLVLLSNGLFGWLYSRLTTSKQSQDHSYSSAAQAAELDLVVS
ncbi:MAG: ABC transporter permease [Mycobacteriales bacterium]